MKATWSIFSMVREPVHILRRFVDHNLGAGASYVHLFFDDPDDPAIDTFANQPGVIAQRCGDDYWQSMNRRRPPFVERRQLLNGRVAYDRCLTDWQAHFDADELMVIDGAPLGAQLATVPESYQTAHLGTLEPMIPPEEHEGPTPFRRSVRHLKFRARRRVYGDDLQIFRNGLFGHYQGKSILRAGLEGWGHGIHFPRPPSRETKNAVFKMDNAWIAHMHCENRDLWVNRTLRKMTDGTYNLRTGNYEILRQVAPEAELENPSEQDLLELLSGFYDRVSVLSEDLRARMEALDLLQYHQVELLD